MGFVFRPLSGVATRLRRQAQDLAREAAKGGLLHRFYEIFLIRAAGSGGDAVATVIETPTYLLGGFGGQNGASNYYTYCVAADFGPLLDAITRESIKIGDSGAEPNITKDEFKLRIPWGDGRLSLGSLPAWGGTRNALNNTTGVYINTPSAVITSVCPSLVDEATEDHPWVRSLFICRANGYMAGSPVVYDGTEQPPIETQPDVPAKHPAVNKETPVGRPERISGLEIAQALLALGANDELALAGPCIEWGPLVGLATVLVREITPPGSSVQGNELRFVRWTVTDNGEDVEPRFTPALAWVAPFGITQTPMADRPTPISAVTAADPLYTYPGWAYANTTVEGRDARDGRLFMRDLNTYMRLHTPLVGFAKGSTETTLALIEIRSEVEGATVSVRGYFDSGIPPVLFNTVSIPANVATKWTTYVAKLEANSTLSLVQLAQFTDSRYDTAGATTRAQVQAYGGFTTLEDVPAPRLFCSEWAVPYEVLPAEPDGGGAHNIQGEPARKVLKQYSNYVALSDLSYYFLDGDGNKVTPAFGDYYPMLYHVSTGAAGITPAPTNARIGFGNSAFYDNNPRVGNNAPMPMCQFAPGMMAIVVAPKAGYTAASQTIRVAVFDVLTGALKALSAALATIQLPATLTLTCVEQGTVVDGELASYGSLLLSVSTTLTTDTRSDGIFAITGLNKLTWVAREPSNIPAVYGGNALVPATLGVTANLTFVKPTAL